MNNELTVDRLIEESSTNRDFNIALNDGDENTVLKILEQNTEDEDLINLAMEQIFGY